MPPAIVQQVRDATRQRQGNFLSLHATNSLARWGKKKGAMEMNLQESRVLEARDKYLRGT